MITTSRRTFRAIGFPNGASPPLTHEPLFDAFTATADGFQLLFIPASIDSTQNV